MADDGFEVRRGCDATLDVEAGRGREGDALDGGLAELLLENTNYLYMRETLVSTSDSSFK